MSAGRGNLSSGNHDASGVILIAAGCFLGAMSFFAFAAVGVLCAVLTFACLIACVRPIRIGAVGIDPREARAFILRGLSVGLVKVAFWWLIAGSRWEPEHYLLALVLGYVLGSIGIEIIRAAVAAESSDTPLSPEPFVAPPPQTPLPPSKPEPKSFHYASWDDEEETRK